MSDKMDYIKLENGKINMEEIHNLVTSPQCGAISTFIGITRDNFEQKKVKLLEIRAILPYIHMYMHLSGLTIGCVFSGSATRI